MRGINTTKLLILAILGFCALVLGSAVLTLQLYLTREKQRLGLLRVASKSHKVKVKTSRRSSGNIGTSNSAATDDDLGSSTSSSSSSSSSGATDVPQTTTTTTTTRPSQPITTKDLHLKESSPPPHGRSFRTVREAYWKQVAAYLQEWDALLEPAVGEDADGSPTEEIPPLFLLPSSRKNHQQWNPQFALQQAANAGHPLAQHYVANAHASGIWPMRSTTTNSSTHDDDDDDDGDGENAGSMGGGSGSTSLHVFDEWSPTAHGDHPQLSKAFVFWHMAAMGGNIESAMALAHRIAELAEYNTMDQDSSSGDPEDASCEQVLPYLEAAAHGIIDQLEASPHSRAKVLPPMDKHILAQVHMHGGTSSQLDWNNKPHESKEAIQFYHLKATTIPWSARFYSSSKNEDASSASTSEETTTIDITAAYTLAHMYHYGLRGVPQNLTQSLMYYEIAGSHGHWESAGAAGTFYLWGIGTSQDVEQALEFFRIGAPFGLEGCRRRHEQTLLLSQREALLTEPSSECDAASLNGLGVLYLLGVPGKIEVDLVMAEKYFALAQEMGNADAMYNLSMMWLGWKTHFKHVHELQDDGVSEDPTEAFVTSRTQQDKKKASTFALHYSKRTDTIQKGPTQSEVQDAIKTLTVAANKGHLQAKHRLAMIYAEGVEIQTAAMKYHAVKPSCAKARGLYQWITEHGSLQRSRRLRKAYRAYTEGEWEVALRNYLAAAETGSNVGQVNAAFLLERGTCLGLSAADCAKASVRLWKAASARGNTEACLRVGDFYYYGRLRGNTLPVGPFGWVQYLLYPEEYLPELLSRWGAALWEKIQDYLPASDGEDSTADKKKEPELKPTDEETKHNQELLEADLSMAAHYYTEAAEKHYSPRANFNLGFMYEWGLGLKQDFPLAKRHYDTAASVSTHGKEADLAVIIALWVMSAHEYFVKLQLSWEDWHLQKRASASPPSSPSGERVLPPKASQKSINAGQPVPGTGNGFVDRTAQDIVLDHIFNWSSLAIAVLVYIVIQLRELRRRRR